jgi:hypothetical protein
MDQSEAIKKAKQFAQTAYTAALDNIGRERQNNIAKMHNQLAARGVILSGATVTETARITGEQIRAMAKARLDSILEGYELYGILVDDTMATDICFDIMGEVTQMIAKATKANVFPAGMPPNAVAVYPQALEQHVGVSTAWVRTQIDRRRLMTKKESSPITNYYVQGENARVNVNSNDHSVNVVTKSKEEFFATLHQRIESGVLDSEERQKILSSLTVLQESHGKPSFAQRYTEFIATAANHVALLTPFIPALTEMLHKVLS